MNASHAAKTTFQNNIVRNKRCRGVLIQTRDAVVQNNTFANLTDAGVLLTSDTGEWYESMPASKVKIAGNKFLNTNLGGGARAAVTAYCYGPDSSDGKMGIMQDITIENNLIANTGHGGILLASVTDSVVTHNAVTNVGLLGRNNFGMLFRKSEKIAVTKNEVIATSSAFKPGVAEECADNAFTVTDNEGLSADDFKVTATVTSTEVAKIGAGRIDLTDGSLSDWEGLGTDIEMAGASNQEQEPVEVDPADFRADMVRFAWDDNGVYIGFDVTDDRISWVPNSYWNGDGVEIFMTKNLDYGSSTEALKSTDASCLQLFMGGELAGGCQVVGVRTSLEVMEHKNDIKMNLWVRADGSGYAGEAFIPFTAQPEIKAAIEAGQEISLCIRFGDSDADGASLVQISNASNPVELNKYVPKRMPKVKFVGEGGNA